MNTFWYFIFIGRHFVQIGDFHLTSQFPLVFSLFIFLCVVTTMSVVIVFLAACAIMSMSYWLSHHDTHDTFHSFGFRFGFGLFRAPIVSVFFSFVWWQQCLSVSYFGLRAHWWARGIDFLATTLTALWLSFDFGVFCSPRRIDYFGWGIIMSTVDIPVFFSFWHDHNNLTRRPTP